VPDPRKLVRIEIDPFDDITFIFDDSKEHFSAGEFMPNTFTRKHLEMIEYEIQDYNSEVELLRNGC
jgi:hypothetical protein